MAKSQKRKKYYPKKLEQRLKEWTGSTRLSEKDYAILRKRGDEQSQRIHRELSSIRKRVLTGRDAGKIVVVPRPEMEGM